MISLKNTASDFLINSIVVCLLMLTGCGETVGPRYTGAENLADDIYSRVTEGTVGSMVTLEGGVNQIIKGYGLVVGLAGNGSSEAPAEVRKSLVQQMGRMGIGDKSSDTRHLTPDRFIDDLDTAVVLVSAAIPPGTTADSYFDVEVSAIPGSQTRSLSGGKLYLTDLHSFTVSGGRETKSLPIARARGNIFVNPFVDPNNPADAAKLLRGVILSGGILDKSRKVALILARPDYGLANMLQQQINSRFPGFPATAKAKNEAAIEITVPDKWQGDFEHFLELLMHLYTRRGGAFLDMKMRSLAEEIIKPGAPYEDISLIWEAMGPEVLPVISDLYTHESPAVRFYSARAGARLKDAAAINVIIELSKKAGRMQLLAIQELGRCRTLNATGALANCFDSEDDFVRMEAFHAMRDNGLVTVGKSANVNDSFELYEIPSMGRPMVYATRIEKEIIVIFGSGLRLRGGVFYNSPDDLLTINSSPSSNKVLSYRRVGSQKRLSDTLSCSAELWSIIATLGGDPQPDKFGKIAGLGLSYSQVVSAIYNLCSGPVEQRKIPAEFVLQNPASSATILQTRPMEGRSNR